MSTRGPNCPETGKSSWRKRSDAERALHKIAKSRYKKSKKDSSPPPRTAYLCRTCGLYHLTSQSDEASAEIKRRIQMREKVTIPLTEQQCEIIRRGKELRKKLR